jgi:fructose-specific phosphotransferase system IIC component
MSYLAMFHWGWLLGALLLGFVAGWIAVVQRSRGVSKVTARWLAVLVAALVAAALTRIVPGRPGYWLDLGLVMFALYLVGCTIGSCLRDWAVSRHTPAA